MARRDGWMQPDAARGDKIMRVLKAASDSASISIYYCGAADAQDVRQSHRLIAGFR